MLLRLVAIVVATSLVGSAGAEEPGLPEARKLLLTGKYAEAIDAYQALAGKQPAAAALGIAKAQASTGQRDEALRTLDAAITKAPKSAELLAERAKLLFERGDLADAEHTNAKALAADKDNVLARWLQAELHQARGQLKDAQASYEWLIDYQNEADKLTADDRLYIGRAAAQYARWTRQHQQFRVLVNDFYPQAIEDDEHYWPAHWETAQLFLEKYNEPEAARALTAGLAINPQAAELHILRAALALQKFDVTNAGAALDRALAINSQLVAAHQLKADLLLADQQPAPALEQLAKARELNPTDEETLGRMVAAYSVIDGAAADAADSRAGKLIAEVTERNAHCGRFFAAIADTFDLMRKYPQAAEHYAEAFRRMPKLLHVRGRHGLVLMRLGEEPAAAKLLEASFEEDPFNVRVKNMLEVLDVLQGYAVLETEHFVIRFDRGQDELLAKAMAEYLENDVYPEVVAKLGFKPEGKSLFEVFSRAKNTRGHGWFSARMVGLPFIGTVGACGGKIVAMTSPNDMPKKFHWGRVVKHEFVHVVNLQQTNFNIPHWFTEGIAVQLEGLPRPTEWNQLLAQRTADDKLFTLANINYGFIRPGSGDDWTLAYCQAELYCDYLTKRFGEGAIARLLSAYRDNLTTVAALEREFKTSLADFEAGYRKFIDEELQRAGVKGKERDESKRSLAELEEAVIKSPQDASLQAQLALGQLEAKNAAAARKAALAAQKLEAQQPLAAYVLARLQVSIGDHDAARALLVAAHDAKQPDERVVSLLASLEFAREDFSATEKLYQLGLTHFAPRDKWLKALAKLHLKTKDDAKLAVVLEELALLDSDNATMRKKLAQLAAAREDWPAAERWAKDALLIDVADAPSHAQMAEALANQARWPAAIAAYTSAIELDPEVPQWRLALADAHLASGQKAEARKVLQKLIEVEPGFPGADVMLEQTEK